MKWISLLLLAAGVVFIGYGGWKIVDTNRQTSQSLQEAKKVIEEGKVSAQEFKPETGDVVGLLNIPKLNADLPIVEGTDADDLEKGVGHYKGSYYPNDNGQIVLSGHRDTVFRRTGELAIGDDLYVRLPFGEYKYKITKTKIVDADDTSIITLQNDHEELLLTTCYPFSYVGNAPDRYIIYAEKDV